MKYAIPTIFAALALAALSPSALADRYSSKLKESTSLRSTDTQSASTVTTASSKTSTDSSNNDGFGTYIFSSPVLTTTVISDATLSGGTINTGTIDPGTTFERLPDDSKDDANNNDRSSSVTVHPGVITTPGIETTFPGGKIETQPDSPNDIRRVETPVVVCNGFSIDNVKVIEGVDKFSVQHVSGCPGTVITSLHFTDETATKAEDYGTIAHVQYKLSGQPWREFVINRPFAIPKDGYFMVRTNIVTDDIADDNEAFRLVVRSRENETAMGRIELLDPVGNGIQNAENWEDLVDALASLNPDEMSPKQALDALYVLQAIQSTDRN
jgi:hypothetical protein